MIFLFKINSLIYCISKTDLFQMKNLCFCLCSSPQKGVFHLVSLTMLKKHVEIHFFFFKAYAVERQIATVVLR